LPATLLTRRPDLLSAERSLEASFKSLESARASRLPTLSLTGALSGASTQLSELLDSENAAWQLAGNLLGPLFDGGLRRGQIDEQSAVRVEALERYAQTALIAFQEVENGLDQYRVLARREEALETAAAAANEALRLARLRYREGETDLLDVLTIQSTTFSADSALVTVRRERLVEWVNLNLALGGSWE
ncbi:MAG: TolC family protein, partial [Pseudomonadota bacterium]